MTNPDLFSALSERLVSLVATAAPHVVRVDGRRRSPSSGTVWSADGVILTCHHNLERDDEVQVGLPSGDTAIAEIVGRDPTTDLAALRVKGGGLSPVAWAEPDVAAGTLVLSVSRPGRTPRAAVGIVARAAGEWRGPPGGKIDRYVETTLDLHPGISGALVLSATASASSAAGPDGAASGAAASAGSGVAAVGIVTAGLVRGTAMVIPTATLRRVVKSLLSHGEIRRGYLGLATSPVWLPEALRDRTGEEVALLVSRVEPDSPAERAGLLLGDAILSFGGETLQDPGELMALLSEDRIGDTVALRVLRGGELRDVPVTIGARGRRS